MRLITALLLAGLLAGCSFQRTLFTETVEGVTTTYKTTLLIPPGGKLDQQSGAMSYVLDEQSRISVGQATSGVDNTNQADLVRAMTELIKEARTTATTLPYQRETWSRRIAASVVIRRSSDSGERNTGVTAGRLYYGLTLFQFPFFVGSFENM